MNAESFEEIITRCPHLSEQQKDDLNSNSKYLSSEERQSLIDGLVHADQELKSIDEREQQSPEEQSSLNC